MIRAILACDAQGGIAGNGVMPWPRNKKDLQHFKALTNNHIVVMGRGTWEATDMPTPLPNRRNIVVTSDPDYVAAGAETLTDNIVETLKELETDNEVFIIGGAGLFKSLIDEIDVLHLGRIQGTFNCDVKLPMRMIKNRFKLIDEVEVDLMTRFETYLRKPK